MKPQHAPDDALLWRVETDHTEVVCFVVAAPDGGVALCVERNEELMIAESYIRLPGASRGALRELRAALGAMGLPAEGNDDGIAAEAAASHWARIAALLACSEPTRAGTAVAVRWIVERRNPSMPHGPSVNARGLPKTYPVTVSDATKRWPPSAGAAGRIRANRTSFCKLPSITRGVA